MAWVNNPKVRVGELVTLHTSGYSAAASDLDHMLLYCHNKPFTVTAWYLMFTKLDAFASNCAFNLQKDTGSAEVNLGSYTTVVGTVVKTVYTATPTTLIPLVVPVGSWLQLNVINSEDVQTDWDLVVEGFFGNG